MSNIQIAAIDGKIVMSVDEFKAINRQIRSNAIDEFKSDIISKINFEDKWLLHCKSNNAYTNVAFSSLRTFIENRAEQLKEQKCNHYCRSCDYNYTTEDEYGLHYRHCKLEELEGAEEYE